MTSNYPKVKPSEGKSLSALTQIGDQTALDTHYIKEHLGRPLTLGLAQICLKKPKDPIEFLAHWLYKYRENELADIDRQKNDQTRELESVILKGEAVGTI